MKMHLQTADWRKRLNAAIKAKQPYSKNMINDIIDTASFSLIAHEQSVE